MKKVLFGSTALVAATFAGSAMAEPFTLSIGGWYQAGIGGGQFSDFSSANVLQDIHIIQNGEIHFNAGGTLDNGLTIKLRMEFEAFQGGAAATGATTYTAAGQVDAVRWDERYVTLEGSFGRVVLGNNDDALSTMAGYTGVTYVGVGGGARDPSYDFAPGYVSEVLGGNSDTASIQYYTPTIAGFQLGVSWSPGLGSADAGGSTADTGIDPINANNRISVGASYSNTFGDVSFTVAGGWMTQSADETVALPGVRPDTTEFGGGVSLGFSGLTLEGQYFVKKVDNTLATLEGTSNYWTAGLSYATGPWTFGVVAAADDLETTSGADGTDSFNSAVGVAYELGDGVAVGAHVNWGETETAAGVTNDGIGGAVVLGISF